MNVSTKSSPNLPRLLCGVVLLVILLAGLYSAWIWIVNFTRIHV